MVFVLLVICTCAYIRNVPKLKQLFLSEKNGIFGALYKGECYLYIVRGFVLCILQLEMSHRWVLQGLRANSRPSHKIVMNYSGLLIKVRYVESTRGGLLRHISDTRRFVQKLSNNMC